MPFPVGICSWSLRPRSPEHLAAEVASCGIQGVQLALDPIRVGAWSLDATRLALAGAGLTILSGMMAMKGEDYSTLESIRRTGGVRPDGHWEANRAAAADNARIARELGLSLVTFHAGFVPHDARDPARRVMVERLTELCAIFAQEGVGVALETGQEDEATLRGLLADLGAIGARVGVNFDPANMILYAMGEPVRALRALSPHVRQVHVKDALPSRVPGQWGTETPAGDGAVDWRSFFDAVRALPAPIALVIEREGGEQRVADVRTAAALIARLA